jgi:hypothetical protein
LASVETIMSIIGMHPIRRPNPSKFLPRMVWLLSKSTSWST